MVMVVTVLHKTPLNVWHYLWNVITGVDTAEVTLGGNLKINFVLNRHAQNDITYLVRDVLHLCMCVFVEMLE